MPNITNQIPSHVRDDLSIDSLIRGARTAIMFAGGQIDGLDGARDGRTTIGHIQQFLDQRLASGVHPNSMAFRVALMGEDPNRTVTLDQVKQQLPALMAKVDIDNDRVISAQNLQSYSRNPRSIG